MLRRARWSIDAAVYEVGPSYAWILSEAARAGVRVRVLLDDHLSDGNVSTSRDVERAGGECRVLGRGAAAAHWKLLVVDRTHVATGTGNLIWRDAPRDRLRRVPPRAAALRGTREWWAVGAETGRLALDAESAFDVAWQRARPPGCRWRARADVTHGAVGIPTPQVAPLRLTAGRARLQMVFGGLPVALAIGRYIERARQRALVTVPYVHPRATAVRRLVGALRCAASRGVDSRVLLGACPRPSDVAWLRAAGVAIRWMDAATSTRGHAKGLIADDVVIISSANWSSAGCGRNWEAALIVRIAAAAAYYAAAWERDWAAAEPLTARVWGVPGADMLRPWTPSKTPP